MHTAVNVTAPSSIRYSAILAFLLTSLTLMSGQVQAQSSASAAASNIASAAASSEEPQSVEVKAVRDPAIMPYKTAYELISKVKAASKDKVEIIIRITAAKTHAPIPNLAIYLDSKENRKKLEISAAGDVTVPMDAVAYAEGAEFVTNQKKGSMEAHIMLLPKLPQDVFKYADVSDSIESARLALKELVPWYLRLFIPSVNGVGICYREQNQTVLVKGNEEQHLAANNDATDPLKNKIHCAKFAASDVAKDKEKLILPATGWQAIFM